MYKCLVNNNLDQVDKFIFEGKKSLEEIQLLFDSLMHEYFE